MITPYQALKLQELIQIHAAKYALHALMFVDPKMSETKRDDTAEAVGAAEIELYKYVVSLQDPATRVITNPVPTPVPTPVPPKPPAPTPTPVPPSTGTPKLGDTVGSFTLTRAPAEDSPVVVPNPITQV